MYPTKPSTPLLAYQKININKYIIILNNESTQKPVKIKNK